LAAAIVLGGLTFLLLASGDTFMQKLVHVMPSRHHKKRAVEISREVQQSMVSLKVVCERVPRLLPIAEFLSP
jgi:predicted PurR-regulated permease PerM